MRRWVMLGGIFGCLAVILGALGAHSLKAVLNPQQLAAFKTAVHYQMVHALALVLTGLLAGSNAPVHPRRIQRAGGCFVAGILLFSGSIYGLTLGGPGFLGPLTPLGGLSFMAGWVFLTFSIRKD